MWFFGAKGTISRSLEALCWGSSQSRGSQRCGARPSTVALAFEPLLGQGEGVWESLGGWGSSGGKPRGLSGGGLASSLMHPLQLSSWAWAEEHHCALPCCATPSPAVLCSCQPGRCTRSHQALGKAGRLPLPWHVGSVGWQGYGGDTPTLAPWVSSLGSSGESSNLPQRPRQHHTSSGGCVSWNVYGGTTQYPFSWFEELDSCVSCYFGIHFSFYHFKVHAFLIVMNTMLKLIVLWLVYYI